MSFLFHSFCVNGQEMVDSLRTLQPDIPKYVIGDILIMGNKRTKTSVILREIPFQKGNSFTLDELVARYEEARRNLQNTALFHHVVVATTKYDGPVVDVLIELKERWYVFPLPHFRLVDRNFNQWWVEHKASLNRVNYGIRVTHVNTTGRNDRFNLSFTNGYTRQFSISYARANLDKEQKWGIAFNLSAGKNREINYNTIDDKQVFLKTDNYLRSFFRTGVGLTYRKAIYTRHSFGFNYGVETIDDSVRKLNPNYFEYSVKRIVLPTFFYNVDFSKLDYNPYPTKGYAAQLSVSKSGFNRENDIWQLQAKALGSWHLSPKYFFSVIAMAGVKLPFRQPFYHQRFLGYNDRYLQGYEYYVIDGVAGGLAKLTLNRRLFDLGVRIPPRKRGALPERIPFRVFGKIYGNAGYVHHPDPNENRLNNKMLFSGGMGLDIVTFYDLTFRIEWSFNQLGQNGLFLHRRSIF